MFIKPLYVVLIIYITKSLSDKNMRNEVEKIVPNIIIQIKFFFYFNLLW